MYIEIQQAELLRFLTFADKVAKSGTTADEKVCKIQASDRGITMKAATTEVQLHVMVQGDTFKQGSVILPTNVLYSHVKAQRPQQMSIQEMADGTVVLSGVETNSQASLRVVVEEPEWFQPFVVSESCLLYVNFFDDLKLATFAAQDAKTHSGPLSGVRVCEDGIIAADGSKFVTIERDLDCLTRPVTIPQSLIAMIPKSSEFGAGDFTLQYHGDHRQRFLFGDIQLEFRTIPQDYPSWKTIRKMIPEPVGGIELETKSTSEAVESVLAVADSGALSRLMIDPDGLFMTQNSNGEWSTFPAKVIDSERDPVTRTVAFAIGHIKEVLRTFKENEALSFTVGEPGTVCTLVKDEITIGLMEISQT